MPSAINCKIAKPRCPDLEDAECNQLQNAVPLWGHRTARILRQKRVPPPTAVLFDRAYALIDGTVGRLPPSWGAPQVPHLRAYRARPMARHHGIRADHLHRCLVDRARHLQNHRSDQAAQGDLQRIADPSRCVVGDLQHCCPGVTGGRSPRSHPGPSAPTRSCSVSCYSGCRGHEGRRDVRRRPGMGLPEFRGVECTASTVTFG
jgi:hypothetical protein